MKASILHILERATNEQGNYSGSQKSQMQRIESWQTTVLNDLRRALGQQEIRGRARSDSPVRRQAITALTNDIKRICGASVSLPKFMDK
jgi:hypothetical protein